MKKSMLMLALCAFSAVAWSGPTLRAVPYRDPAPLVTMTKLPIEAVHNAILEGAKQREWKIVSDTPGYIEATISPRTHQLKIGITYDTQQISMKYLDSVDLNYRIENGQRMLHPSAASWLSNLVGEINVYLLRAEPLE